MEAIDNEGLALENLPALPHINVVGSTVTGTHGSGINHQAFANKVIAFDFVSADGTLRSLSLDNTPNFKNHILNFGPPLLWCVFLDFHSHSSSSLRPQVLVVV